MLEFVVRTAWKKLWTIFFVSIISFAVIHLAPGSPSQIDPLNPRFTREQLQRYRTAFDLDRPLPVQYSRFYWKLFTGELRSFKDNQPVLPKIVWREMSGSRNLCASSIVITSGLGSSAVRPSAASLRST